MQLWTDHRTSNLPSGRPASRLVAVTLGFVFALYIVWTGAWIVLGLLEEHVGWPTTSEARSLYWTALKLLFWVLPSLLLFRYSGMSVRAAFRGKGLRPTLLWGVGAGLLIGAEVVVRKWIRSEPYSLVFDWPLVSVVVIAPFVEELLFRGAVLGGALSIFVLGLIFGFVTRQSRSVLGGMLTHGINNLFSVM